MTARSRAWVLRQRPSGRPTAHDVELTEHELPPLAPGWVRVTNEVMSLEPYMRGRMGDTADYAQAWALDEPMRGPTVGTVSDSRDPGLPVGTLVSHDLGWRTVATLPAAQARAVPRAGDDPSIHLTALGVPGFTAWIGLHVIARVRPGDVTFVSSAAGAVGSMAVSLAKAAGCRVVASAGPAHKVTLVAERLAPDVAFSYRDGGIAAALPRALAELGRRADPTATRPSIDVYFDNVGGDHLEAAIRHLGDGARIALCGMTSVYDEPGPGPRNLLRLIWRRARMEGFLMSDHESRRAEFEAAVLPLIASGELPSLVSGVPGGIDGAFDGFTALLDSALTGKAIVRLT